MKKNIFTFLLFSAVSSFAFGFSKECKIEDVTNDIYGNESVTNLQILSPNNFEQIEGVGYQAKVVSHEIEVIITFYENVNSFKIAGFSLYEWSYITGSTVRTEFGGGTGSKYGGGTYSQSYIGFGNSKIPQDLIDRGLSAATRITCTGPN